MIIYKITNLINGKIYVGKQLSANGRYKNYLGSGKILKQAIIKYGKENFKKEILQECVLKAEWLDAEKFWIEKLNSRDRSVGYNLAVGGDGGKTVEVPWNKGLKLGPLSEEQKKKQSDTLKKRYLTQPHPSLGKIPWNKNKVGAQQGWNKGLKLGPMPEEQRTAHSEAMKGKNKYPKSETHKEKLSKALLGRKLPEETKQKMKKHSSKGRPQKKIQCPHCGKIGGTTMYRWHFDNCIILKGRETHGG
jgi:group I intron endonuclease